MKALEYLDKMVLADPRRETSYQITRVGNGKNGTASIRMTFPGGRQDVAVGTDVEDAAGKLALSLGWGPEIPEYKRNRRKALSLIIREKIPIERLAEKLHKTGDLRVSAESYTLWALDPDRHPDAFNDPKIAEFVVDWEAWLKLKSGGQAE